MASALRWALLALALAATLCSTWLFVTLAYADGWSALDGLRLALSSACVFWLGWGAIGGLFGLVAHGARDEAEGPLVSRTAILVPIYNEDPPSTFARIAAVSTRLSAIGVHEAFDIFILSDSQSPGAAAREALWLERLLTDAEAREHIFYRRRTVNTGRKAGNIEDFIRRSGGAYDYALVLDADSLMEAETIVALVRRMTADPRIGLLQTLPRIVRARSIFGRAVQFAAQLYTPAFAHGAAHLQGAEGPYWGHNAIFRVSAFAQCCGLPALAGKPPFGGHVLSHDYVEAALLARRGWAVRLDADLGGSYEEGPETIIDFAKRDQRWCQGNLQHLRVLLAPGLRVWNRATLLQGILSYLLPLLWLILLVASIAAVEIAQGPRFSYYIYYAQRPDWAGVALIAVVAALLILPKLLIGMATLAAGRRIGWRNGVAVGVSMLAEIVLSTFVAPVVLMYSVRAVLRVLLGWDGGWPPSNRDGGTTGLKDAWAASWWITCTGATSLAIALAVAPGAALWCLFVALPMILAPFVIVWTSRPSRPAWLWAVPTDTAPGPVLREYEAILAAWAGASADSIERDFSTVSDVAG